MTNSSVKVECGLNDLSRRNPNKECGHTVTRGIGVIQKHATHCENHVQCLQFNYERRIDVLEYKY